MLALLTPCAWACSSFFLFLEMKRSTEYIFMIIFYQLVYLDDPLNSLWCFFFTLCPSNGSPFQRNHVNLVQIREMPKMQCKLQFSFFPLIDIVSSKSCPQWQLFTSSVAISSLCNNNNNNCCCAAAACCSCPAWTQVIIILRWVSTKHNVVGTFSVHKKP